MEGKKVILHIYICIMLLVTLVVHDEQAKEGLRAINVRSMNQALKVDFILVHCGDSHYISLGNTF